MALESAWGCDSCGAMKDRCKFAQLLLCDRALPEDLQSVV